MVASVLSLKASHEFWSNFQEKSVYRSIVLLESVETGYLDGQADYEKKMTELGAALESAQKENMPSSESVVRLLAYTKTSRYLRILQLMDSADPGSASKVIAFAEKSPRDHKDAQIFLRRNMLFERYRIYVRIFSKDRFKLVSSALEEI